MLISEEFPEFVAEVQGLLRKRGEHLLAEQVPGLNLVDRCRCNDDFCATIYTQPKPVKKYGPSHRALDLDAETGVIIVDVVDGKIACLEILNRDEIRKTLLTLLS